MNKLEVRYEFFGVVFNEICCPDNLSRKYVALRRHGVGEVRVRIGHDGDVAPEEFIPEHDDDGTFKMFRGFGVWSRRKLGSSDYESILHSQARANVLRASARRDAFGVFVVPAAWGLGLQADGFSGRIECPDGRVEPFNHWFPSAKAAADFGFAQVDMMIEDMKVSAGLLDGCLTTDRIE